MPALQINRLLKSLGLCTMLGGQLTGLPAFANEAIRPMSFGELRYLDQRTERVYYLPLAKVAYVDYRALRRDFPRLSSKSATEIETWILDEFAYVSQAQIVLGGVRSSEITVDQNRFKIASRPPMSGRAADLEARLEGTIAGIVNVKGIGLSDDHEAQMTRSYFETNAHDASKIDSLRDKDHSDGLMSSGEAVAEAARQQAVQRLFDLHDQHHSSGFETVETYFIIDTGFEILRSNNQSMPAALYGRQAHWGRLYGKEGKADFRSSDLYYDPYPQSTWSGSVIDFGNVSMRGSPFSWFSEDERGEKVYNSQKSRIWAEGHRVAAAFREGNLNAVRNYLELVIPHQEFSRRPSPDALALDRIRAKNDIREVFSFATTVNDPLLLRIFGSVSQEKEFQFLDSMTKQDIRMILENKQAVPGLDWKRFASSFESWLFFRRVEDRSLQELGCWLALE